MTTLTQDTLPDFIAHGKKIERKPNKDTTGFLYIIKCKDYYKIGRSSYDPINRLGTLQVGNPFKLELYRTERVKCHEYVEYLMHSLLFYDKWLRGEWYMLDENDLFIIDQFLDECMVEVGG